MVARSLVTAERTCVLRGLAAGARHDLRRPRDGRSVSVCLDEARRGAATVCIGATRALAVVGATLMRPNAERLAEGLVSYYVELAGGAHPHDDWASPGAEGAAGPASAASSSTAATLAGDDERDRLRRLLERVLRTGASRLVDASALCVVPGEAVWALRVDVVILADDGSAADAALAAAVAALCDYRRPDHAVDAETGAVRVFSPDERPPVPLALGPVTLLASALVVGVESALETDATVRRVSPAPVVLVDPSAVEEALLRSAGGRGVSRISAAFSASPSAPGALTLLFKAGGEPVQSKLLAADVLPVLQARVREIAAALDAALAFRA